VVGIPFSVVVGETDPHGAVGHETVQVTPLFAGSYAIVAVNCSVVFTGTVVLATLIVTVSEGMLITAVADAELLATEVAVMVTFKPSGRMLLGAV